ncbi:MAG: alpha/beta hydrolase [Maricaulaceae bacterium]
MKLFKTLPGAAYAWMIAMAACAGTVQAQTLAPRDIPQRGVQSFTFDSKIMGLSYDVTVRVPNDYSQTPDGRFPAIVLVDGNRFFPAAQGALTAIEGALASPMILIAIGTPFEAGNTEYGRRRAFQFSPPGWTRNGAYGAIISASCERRGVTDPQSCTGGADAFLTFLTDEIVPVLAQDFRIDTQNLALAGVSAGGAFATWTMFQEASPFSAYIISSGVMAMGDGALYALEESFAATHSDLNARVYFSSGSREGSHPVLERVGEIASGQARMAAALNSRQYPSLQVFSEVQAGLGHEDGFAAAMVKGLRALYAE